LNAKKLTDRPVIIIKDNGKGFSENAVSGGAGLQNLQNRARIINAELTIDSQPAMGTLVTISIKPEGGG
jgi:signal transduction histidine kinase